MPKEGKRKKRGGKDCKSKTKKKVGRWRRQGEGRRKREGRKTKKNGGKRKSDAREMKTI